MKRFENLEFDDQPRKEPARADAAPKVDYGGSPIRDAQYYQNEADTAFRLADFEQALQSYSRALEDDHKRIACWVGQLRALVELGEYKEALLWAKKSLELFPEHPELLAEQAVAAARAGMMSAALAYSDNALSGQGVTPLVWLARGEVLLASRGRLAENCFAQALALAEGERGKGWVRVDVARLMLRYKRPAQAVKYAEPAVEALPGESAAWLTLGLSQSRLGLRKAAESLERALELNPACRPAREALQHYKPGGFFAGLKRLVGLS